MLRELMTKEMKDYGWLDYSFKRGDRNAKNFASYEDWLNSLSDDDFLSSYNNFRDSYNQLD